ncbi:mechanosensitive ion channel family protein [Paraflavitalea pollutisoli]|uniref:mechanosensitive ion channel family protein n=1 Tax=Paraflavitalea pollutisoli TaxID=3034143 RepID=UPI0023EB520F|nr:mechanosensitive ion channel domain-containing protein [Paraflavitalea sp. H1-2-19X]
MRVYQILSRWLFGPTLLLCVSVGVVQGQQQDTTVSVPGIADTVEPVFRDPIKRIKDRGRESIAEFRTDKLAIRQDDLLEQIRKNINNAKAYLKRSLDTAAIIDDLDQITHWYTIAGEGVFTNPGELPTHRNLATTTKILEELLRKASVRKEQIDRLQRDLMRYRNNVDSLTSDSTLYAFSNDSLQLVQYFQKLKSVAHELRPADSILEKVVPRIRTFQLRCDELVSILIAGLEEIEQHRLAVSVRSFTGELPPLWKPAFTHRTLREVLAFSVAKDRLSWQFFLQNNRGNLFLLALLILAATVFLRSLKKKTVKAGLLQKEYEGQHLLRFPLLSAIVIVVTLFQFIFPNPPFVFSASLWLVVAICLSFVFRHGVAVYWLRAWFVLIGLYIAASAVNLVLQPSRTERWCMMLLSGVGCVLGALLLFNKHRNELREKAILYFAGFMLALEGMATIANLYGWYNFSKTSLVSGYCSGMIAVQMLWTIRLINEGLYLASQVYHTPDKKLFYINFDRIGKKAPPIFYLFLVVGWFILFGRNFYLFHLLTDPVEDLLFTPRTIGDYSFSIGGVLAFFLILALSVVVSRIVSFFASEDNGSRSSGEKKVGLGSWLLLVRIAIISIGMFLAFAAAGIPLDKITLILGALGVGIGFGLQTLVNNLVSGLIIAFEKPVNVGDIVSVAGKEGTIKSIGFRSSILAAWDGAVVVIPNGDLLNQHVVNWTQGNTLRRGDLTVGVGYGTDLGKAQEILQHILQSHEKILKFPAPAVLNTSFNSSAIDFQLFFWLGHPRDLGQTKSDVINAIQQSFKDAGIDIPYPHQDLHITVEASEEKPGTT